MEEITAKELKPGDIFVGNDDYRNYHHTDLKIVYSLRILEEYNTAYVRYKFLGEDGHIRCSYEIYGMDFNVSKII